MSPTVERQINFFLIGLLNLITVIAKAQGEACLPRDLSSKGTVQVEKTVPPNVTPLCSINHLFPQLTATLDFRAPCWDKGYRAGGQVVPSSRQHTGIHVLMIEVIEASGILTMANLLHSSIFRRAFAHAVKSTVPGPFLLVTKHLDIYVCFSREGLPLQDMQDSAELHRTVPSSCQRLQKHKNQ